MFAPTLITVFSAVFSSFVSVAFAVPAAPPQAVSDNPNVSAIAVVKIAFILFFIILILLFLTDF